MAGHHPAGALGDMGAEVFGALANAAQVPELDDGADAGGEGHGEYIERQALLRQAP